MGMVWGMMDWNQAFFFLWFTRGSLSRFKKRSLAPKCWVKTSNKYQQKTKETPWDFSVTFSGFLKESFDLFQVYQSKNNNHLSARNSKKASWPSPFDSKELAVPWANSIASPLGDVKLCRNSVPLCAAEPMFPALPALLEYTKELLHGIGAVFFCGQKKITSYPKRWRELGVLGGWALS